MKRSEGQNSFSYNWKTHWTLPLCIVFHTRPLFNIDLDYILVWVLQKISLTSQKVIDVRKPAKQFNTFMTSKKNIKATSSVAVEKKQNILEKWKLGDKQSTKTKFTRNLFQYKFRCPINIEMRWEYEKKVNLRRQRFWWISIAFPPRDRLSKESRSEIIFCLISRSRLAKI